MRGMPARAIQELAGTRIWRRRNATCIWVRRRSTAPSGCLEAPAPYGNFGDMLETEIGPVDKSNA